MVLSIQRQEIKYIITIPVGGDLLASRFLAACGESSKTMEQGLEGARYRIELKGEKKRMIDDF